MNVAGGDVGAQVRAHEDARILHPTKVDGDSMVCGPLYYIQIRGYSIQDTRQHHTRHKKQE